MKTAPTVRNQSLFEAVNLFLAFDGFLQVVVPADTCPFDALPVKRHGGDEGEGDAVGMLQALELRGDEALDLVAEFVLGVEGVEEFVFVVDFYANVSHIFC